MLTCDGYKMFRGTVRITPVNGRPAFDMTGDWLYKPDIPGIWYCKPNYGLTVSFGEDIMSDFREEDGNHE